MSCIFSINHPYSCSVPVIVNQEELFNALVLNLLIVTESCTFFSHCQYSKALLHPYCILHTVSFQTSLLLISCVFCWVILFIYPVKYLLANSEAVEIQFPPPKLI
ncbi:hypothetical protein XELAEV_18021068mg [Xenopus laevis]|uniref:Uncharacterized protein n=1 Tax=Xenopus laevis TaxID=8355 RepID=A0A974D869_XENLA|nr:hypothetical protein XELAEV_18021068mg [Xenopus laevis]